MNAFFFPRLIQGFFYTVCPSAVMYLCEHAYKNNKIFCTNLSAEFICEFYGDKLMDAMPYVDFLFGNETVTKRFFITINRW